MAVNKKKRYVPLCRVYFFRGIQFYSEGNLVVNYAELGMEKVDWREILDNRAFSVFSITNIVNRVMDPF